MTANTITAADFIKAVAAEVANTAYVAPREVAFIVRKLEEDRLIAADAAARAARFDDSDAAALAACAASVEAHREYTKAIVERLTYVAAAYAYHEEVSTDEEFTEFETLRAAMFADEESDEARAAYYAVFNKRAAAGLAMLPADRSVFISAYNVARFNDAE